MKIDLDEHERIARAAKPGPWQWGRDGRYIGGLYAATRTVISLDSGSMWSTAFDDTAHIAANSPDVTLALIARIRELEHALAELTAECEERAESKHGDWYGSQRELLAKGCVLP